VRARVADLVSHDVDRHGFKTQSPRVVARARWDSCSVRCIQTFSVPLEKSKPVPKFTRGPAMKYNRGSTVRKACRSRR